MDVATAYEACATVTRTRAANFFYGIRLLPAEKRRALCAVYALSRRVDDIGDGDLSTAEKLDGLSRERARLRRMHEADEDPVLVALSDASSRFPIPIEVFEELIDGVEMDVRGTSYETFDELLVYCRRVAGSIGRLSLGVFGASDMATAARHADELGVAMQLTNILRDVREDREHGRVYLPREDLVRYGVDARVEGPPEPIRKLVSFEAARARSWFQRGLALLPMLDHRSAACVGAMSGIYRRLLARIERDPVAVLAGRLSLRAWEKAWVAARSLAGVRA